MKTNKTVTFFLSRSYNSNTVRLSTFEPSRSPLENDSLRNWWYWTKDGEINYSECLSLQEAEVFGLDIQPGECINLSNGVRWKYEAGRKFPRG